MAKITPLNGVDAIRTRLEEMRTAARILLDEANAIEARAKQYGFVLSVDGYDGNQTRTVQKMRR